MKHTEGTTGRTAGRCLVLASSAIMVLSTTGCGDRGGNQPPGQTESGRTGLGQTQATVSDSGKIVNIGVTSLLNTLNPLLMDGVEMNKYATGLVFLPLVELGQNTKFERILADSVTAGGERDFLVHIDDKAVRSDGTPVTVGDMTYTALRFCSPVIGSPAMVYYIFEDVGDDGFMEGGADHVEDTTRVDDKVARFAAKAPTSFITSNSSYTHYLVPLPKHVIGDVSGKTLALDPWFNHPDMVSGPYKVTGLNQDHCVSYEVNKDYWEGAPMIERPNIKIVGGSQLYAGLKSEEIGTTQSTISTIPLEDYESVAVLENVEVSYGAPIINQSAFANTDRITDAEVRQAMLYAVDHSQLLEQLLKGNGEVVDGFLSSVSPYFDSSLVLVPYDPGKTKNLLAENGWNQSESIRSRIDSGDNIFVNAASVIATRWTAVDTKADIQTTDINTLVSTTSSDDSDVLTVQYIYPSVDPYADVAWPLDGEGSWTGHTKPGVEEALSNVTLTNNESKLKELYGIMDRKVQENVPMFSAYIIRTMAAANKRLIEVKPSVYSFSNHAEQRDVTQQNISRQNVSRWKVSRQDNPIVGEDERIPKGHVLFGYLHPWEIHHQYREMRKQYIAYS